MADDDEDDYLSMSFAEPAKSTVKETSIQRTARLKREAALRGRPLSKADLAAKAEAARDVGLSTKLDSSNKGAQLMAKMGFTGGALGAAGNEGRQNPIEIMMREGRGGIGVDSEKKRKLRELGDEQDALEKKVKLTQEEYRDRARQEQEDKRAEGQWWSAMRIFEGLEEGQTAGDGEIVQTPATHTKRLTNINLLYRPLVKDRREKDEDRKAMKAFYDTRPGNLDPELDDDDKLAIVDDEHEDLVQEDTELNEYEALPPPERLNKIVSSLRNSHHYCFWCKYQYPDDQLEGCPGATEDEHG